MTYIPGQGGGGMLVMVMEHSKAKLIDNSFPWSSIQITQHLHMVGVTVTVTVVIFRASNRHGIGTHLLLQATLMHT